MPSVIIKYLFDIENWGKDNGLARKTITNPLGWLWSDPDTIEALRILTENDEVFGLSLGEHHTGKESRNVVLIPLILTASDAVIATYVLAGGHIIKQNVQI